MAAGSGPRELKYVAQAWDFKCSLSGLNRVRILCRAREERTQMRLLLGLCFEGEGESRGVEAQGKVSPGSNSIKKIWTQFLDRPEPALMSAERNFWLVGKA